PFLVDPERIFQADFTILKLRDLFIQKRKGLFQRALLLIGSHCFHSFFHLGFHSPCLPDFLSFLFRFRRQHTASVFSPSLPPRSFRPSPESSGVLPPVPGRYESPGAVPGFPHRKIPDSVYPAERVPASAGYTVPAGAACSAGLPPYFPEACALRQPAGLSASPAAAPGSDSSTAPDSSEAWFSPAGPESEENNSFSSGTG